jgi:UDP-N-acetylglucosamine acyltransferase
MNFIHPTAVIAPDASLGEGVSIGPYSIVENGVEIGSHCRIEGHAVIKTGTTLGANNFVADAAILGAAPQHARCPDKIGSLIIGNGNTFRENVTAHRALDPNNATRIGDGCLLMVNSHVGHDCVIGSNVIMANNVMLAGHVSVADRAYISGAVGVHQFCRIGTLAMVGGQAHVTKDVPPFVTVDGVSSKIVGLNLVGLKRNGFNLEEIRKLKKAYRVAFRSGMRWDDMLKQLDAEFPSGHGHELARFIRESKRGCVHERTAPRAATIKLHQPEPKTDTRTDRDVA